MKKYDIENELTDYTYEKDNVIIDCGHNIGGMH